MRRAMSRSFSCASPQHPLEIKVVLLSGLENEVDALDQLVHVTNQFLL